MGTKFKIYIYWMLTYLCLFIAGFSSFVLFSKIVGLISLGFGVVFFTMYNKALRDSWSIK
jgi:hypothetical protein